MQPQRDCCPVGEVPPAVHQKGVCFWCTPFAVHGSCEHLLLALHVWDEEAFRRAYPARTRRRRGKAKAAAALVEESVGAASASAAPAATLVEESVGAASSSAGPREGLTEEVRQATERDIAKTIRSFEFFEESARRRRASRLTRL